MNSTISKIVDYACKVAEPEQIILFGSMSNGNHNVFSDIDLLIVSENTLAKKHIVGMITSYTRELSLKADVLVYSKSEIENEMHRPNSFIAAILKSGKLVFEDKKRLTL